MKNTYSLIVVLITCFNYFAKSNTREGAISAKEKAMVKQSLHDNGVGFLENKGQMTDTKGSPVPSVLFKAEAPGMDMYITEKGLTYVFVQMEEDHEEEKAEHTSLLARSPFEKTAEETQDKIKTKMAWVNVSLKGADIKKENIIKEQPSLYFKQYFLGHCPDGITDVREYEKLIIKNIYPGIDWIFYNSTEKGFKYDFIVHPGANSDDIKLIYESENTLNIDAEGDINLRTQLGSLRERAPYSYLQETASEVKSSFTKIQIDKHHTQITFQLNHTLNNQTLVIDPQLVWATFYGGSSSYDGPRSITTDNSGNVLVIGYTASTNFPVQTAGTFFQGTNAVSPDDAFILKFNNAGALLWATYYGGNNFDEGYSIATDGNNNVYVTGWTRSTNFPVQNAGAFFQGANAGADDVFILKFNNVGTRLWATYYGGDKGDNGCCITTDGNNNVFVTGSTTSATFPVCNGSGCCGTCASGYSQGTAAATSGDVFILKFNNTCTRLWATNYGGSGYEEGRSIITDSNDNVFVTGLTTSADFPLLNAGTFFQPTIGGGVAGWRDVFILKFDNTGIRQWATFYGGSKNDYGYTIATDNSGNIFVTGSVESVDFPVQNAGTYFDNTIGGTGDVFILKFSNSGVRLWATYYGGSGHDYADSYHNLAIDPCENVYMGFNTLSSDISTQPSCDNGYFDNSFNGNTEVFIIRFSNTGIRLWATYLGGNGMDIRASLTIDNNNNLFISGEWINASDAAYPLTNPGGGAYYDGTYNGSDDAFMIKFTPIPIVLNSSVTNGSCGCNGSTKVTPGGICNYTYLWNPATGGQTTQMATGLCAGNYSVIVTDTLLCRTATATMTVTMGGVSFSLTSTQTNAVCNAFGSATVSPVGGTPSYSYVWSPSGGTNASATGLSSGTYTVIATDASGCSATTIVVIPSAPPLIGQFAKGTAICSNCGCKEWVMVTATGGTGPYSYSWSASGGIVNRYRNQLCPGSYTINITDKNGCSVNVNLSTP